MSRLRSTLAATPLDREVSGSIETARRSVLAALKTCEIQAKDRANPQRPRILAVKRDLLRVLGAMADVRRVSNGYAAEEVKPSAKNPKDEVVDPVVPEAPTEPEEFEESDE